MTVPEKRWRVRSRGGAADGTVEGEEGFGSGDCDDEDECSGTSGLGPPPRRKRLRIFAGQCPNRTVVWMFVLHVFRRPSDKALSQTLMKRGFGSVNKSTEKTHLLFEFADVKPSSL